MNSQHVAGDGRGQLLSAGAGGFIHTQGPLPSPCKSQTSSSCARENGTSGKEVVGVRQRIHPLPTSFLKSGEGPEERADLGGVPHCEKSLLPGMSLGIRKQAGGVQVGGRKS